MNWNDISDEQYFHGLHFNNGVAQKFDDLCKESVEFIFNSLSISQKEEMLKEYLFRETREQSSPKDLFLFLERSDGKYLIEKYNISPKDFI